MPEIEWQHNNIKVFFPKRVRIKRAFVHILLLLFKIEKRNGKLLNVW